MVSKAAQELGRKGGSVSSERKSIAARRNASLPRKKRPTWHIPSNPLPEMSATELLEHAVMVLEDEVSGMNMLYIDGHPLDQLIKLHLNLPLDKTAREVLVDEA